MSDMDQNFYTEGKEAPEERNLYSHINAHGISSIRSGIYGHVLTAKPTFPIRYRSYGAVPFIVS
jgi:hypothetical protein